MYIMTYYDFCASNHHSAITQGASGSGQDPRSEEAHQPGSHHWQIFEQLCTVANASGNLIPDAWFAALAIEHRCTWVTLDNDFARFPKLSWLAL
jgi:predicted nucleic acid-binding protein